MSVLVFALNRSARAVARVRGPVPVRPTRATHARTAGCGPSAAKRRVLKDLREDQTLDAAGYRRYYLKAKGGSYRSIAHMRTQMGVEGVQFKESE